ncbi:hypothetical protein Ciccas_008653, partial [Cichlidogyrus casuarinus]
FREKYHPDYLSKQKSSNLAKRLQLFNKLNNEGSLDDIPLDQVHKDKIIALLNKFDVAMNSETQSSIGVVYIPHVSFYLYRKDLERLFSKDSNFIRLRTSEPVVSPMISARHELFNSSKLLERQTPNELRRPAWITFSPPPENVTHLLSYATELDAERVSLEKQQIEVPKNDSDDDPDEEQKKPAIQTPSDLLERSILSAQVLPPQTTEIQVRISRLGSSIDLSKLETVRRHLVIAAKLVFWLDELSCLWGDHSSSLPVLWSSRAALKKMETKENKDKSEAEESGSDEAVEKEAVEETKTDENSELKDQFSVLPELIIPRVWTDKELDPGPDQASAFRILSDIFTENKQCNPLLMNIIENFIEEVTTEDDIVGLNLSPEKGPTDLKPTPDVDANLAKTDLLLKILDKLILYLRLVHSVDFYGPAMYAEEELMPRSCGIIHIRPSQDKTRQLMTSVSAAETLKREKTFTSQLVSLLRLKMPLVNPEYLIKITDKTSERANQLSCYDELVSSGHLRVNPEDEAALGENWKGIKLQEACITALIKSDCLLSRLGLRDPEDAVEEFVKANTKRKKRKLDTIWLCPLSDKKFREPIFVRKHIMNKFLNKVIEAKRENALFFNNYLLDSWRPQNVTRPRAVSPVEKRGFAEKEAVKGNHVRRKPERMAEPPIQNSRHGPPRRDYYHRDRDGYNNRPRGGNRGFRGGGNNRGRFNNNYGSHDRGGYRGYRAYHDLDAA